MFLQQCLNNVQEVLKRKPNFDKLINKKFLPFLPTESEGFIWKNGSWSNHSGLCHFRYAPTAWTELLYRKCLLIFPKHAFCDSRALERNRRLEKKGQVFNIFQLKQWNKEFTRQVLLSYQCSERELSYLIELSNNGSSWCVWIRILPIPFLNPPVILKPQHGYHRSLEATRTAQMS